MKMLTVQSTAGEVLDYIGVEWRDRVFDMKNNQLSLLDIEEG